MYVSVLVEQRLVALLVRAEKRVGKQRRSVEQHVWYGRCKYC